MSVNVGFGYLSEVAVAVDVLLLMAVLQLVVFDVQPKSLHDVGPSLCVHAQQTGQTWVQFVLRGLGTEKKKKKRKSGHVLAERHRRTIRLTARWRRSTWPVPGDPA